MSASIGQINLDLGINSSGFKKQLNGVTKTATRSANSMAGVFGKLAKVAAVAFSVKAIVNFSKECLRLGSDLAEVQNVVDVTFGSMSGKVNQFAKDAMTSFGLSEKVAKEYMGQFGAMSKAFGNTEAMAYEQAAALTGLAGDVASFYNMSTDEAFTKLKAVYTGETEALKSLGVVMTQTALDEYALQKGMGKTTSQMSEQEKVALRLAFVTDRLSGASGDFVRTADGWANQTRVLALRFDAIKASIGQGLIAALTPVIRVINQLVAHLQVAADAFSNFMQAVFGKADTGSALASSVGSAAISSGDLAENTANTAASAAKIKKSLAGFDKLNILSSSDSGAGGSSSGAGTSTGTVTPDVGATTGAVDTIKLKLGELKTKLLEIANITGLSNLWNDFLIGVNNVRGGLANLWSSFTGGLSQNNEALEEFKLSLETTFLTVSQTLTSVWGSIWTTLTSNFQLWTEENKVELETFFGSVIEIVTSYGTTISTVFGDMYADMGEWWKTAGQPVFDGFLKAIGDVATWVLDLYNVVISPVLKKIGEVVNNVWQTTLRPLWQNLLGLITDIGDLLLALWNSILKPLVDNLIERFGPPIRLVFTTIVESIGNAFKIIGGVVNGMVTQFRGFIQFLTGVFKGDWKKAWEGIKNIFKGAFDSIKAVFTGVINQLFINLESFLNGFIIGINHLISKLNKIQFDVPDWVPGIGGKSIGVNIPKIKEISLPRLATGGYVAANTPRLAVVGDNKREGEIIAPESKIAEAVAKGFAMVLNKLQGQNGPQNKQPIHLTVKLGEDDFWSGFVDYHNDIVKRTGDSPLLV